VLERGWRVREILKQPQYKPIRVAEQIAALLAITGGTLDAVPLDRIGEAEAALRKQTVEQSAALCGRIESGEKLAADDRKHLLEVAGAATESMKAEESHADD